MMQIISLETWHDDWQRFAQELERSRQPVGLEIDGKVYGILLPTNEAVRVVARYADREAAQTQLAQATPAEGVLLTYLELLRDDSTLVPVIDGQPLEFVTMMNSSYVNPEQLYEFRNPRTGGIVVLRANQLRDAIGRQFAKVEFVPTRPRDVVEGKLKLR